MNDGLIVTSLPKLPTRATSSLQQTREELCARCAQEWRIALHAAGHVEHHDETYRLGRFVELNNRLGRTFVANFEVLLRESRDQPAVAIGHRGEDADRITSAAKDWLLVFRLLGCTDDGQGTGNE